MTEQIRFRVCLPWWSGFAMWIMKHPLIWAVRAGMLNVDRAFVIGSWLGALMARNVRAEIVRGAA